MSVTDDPPPKSGMARAHRREQISSLLREIAGRGEGPFALLKEFEGGDGPGAYELASEIGPAVLKAYPAKAWDRLPSVVRTLDTLVARGYPAPRALAAGRWEHGCYLIQERLPGEALGGGAPPQHSLMTEHVRALIDLNDAQADWPVPLGDDWPGAILRPVLEGGDGFCVLETMREHSSETAELLMTLQDMASKSAASVESRTDLVHLDFSAANILASDGRITGVIDWEGAVRGDRAFDLVTLQFYAFDDSAIRQPLWDKALAISGPEAMKLYFAHMILRQTEWSIRFHSSDTVEYFVRRAATILDALGRL